MVIEDYLNQIIDEVHPLFTPSSDEQLIEKYDDRGVYTRSFKHANGKNFLMKWVVYYGTPDTVKTVFEPAIQI
jgi:hypothetical protein